MTFPVQRFCATMLMLTPTVAAAHVGHDPGSGLASGLLHPVLGPDHVLAMIAVGVWAAQLGRPALWLLPVVFAVVMAMGGLLGMAGVPLPGVEVGIAASALLLGALVLAAARPWLWVSVTVVGVFALFHGHAHGTGILPGQSALMYGLGFVSATGILHAVGISIGAFHRTGAGRYVPRAAGGAVSAAGLFLLVGAMA